MVAFENPGPTITEKDLARLEQVVARPLPDTYRRFLLVNNGGIPCQNVVVEIEGLVGTPTDLQVLFGINRLIESSDLFWNIQVMSDRLAGKALLPIGCDSTGCLFCLSLSDDHYGVILFWDWNFGDLEGKLYPVARDFTAFLNKLRSVD